MEIGPVADGSTAKARAANALRKRRKLIHDVFEDAYQYMKTGGLLRQVINRLESDIDFNDSESRHLFGDIYEQILRDLQGPGTPASTTRRGL